MSENFEALEKTLGYTFKTSALLEEAMTHSTFANEQNENMPHNERLEFLGDAVLDLIAARILYEKFGHEEGEMSRRRAAVVQRSGLVEQASALGLEKFLRVGVGHRRDGIGMRLMANVYESLVGAVFLDGGYIQAERCFGSALEKALFAVEEAIDNKSKLQEYCHRENLGEVRYKVLESFGPAHARVFKCGVMIQGEVIAQAQAGKKKEAEQACAEIALKALSER